MTTLARQRLLAQLPSAEECRTHRPGTPGIVLLSAPAGSGKSTLVDQWLAADPAQAARARRVRCTGAGTFWDRLLRALAGPDAEPRGSESAREAVERVVEALDEPVTLVIDEYQTATTAENDLALVDLVAANERLTLVIMARRMRLMDGPLITSRATVRVIDRTELDFTREESLELATALGVPDDARLRAAMEQAGGWALAVRAALGTTARTAPEARRGSHRAGGEDRRSSAADPLVNLDRFAEQHLEIVSDPARRILLATAIIDALGIDLAAGCTGLPEAEARDALQELLELGVVEEFRSGDRTEYRCHSALRPALVARAERVYSVEERADLFRARAREIEESDPATAFRMLCAVGSLDEAAALLIPNFASIVAGDAEVVRVVRAIPEPLLVAHPAFASARLFLERDDVDVPPATLAHLTTLLHEAAQARLASVEGAGASSGADAPEGVADEEVLAALVQAMASARLSGDRDRAGEIADEIEHRLSATRFGAAEFGFPGAPTRRRGMGSLPIYYREIALTFAMTGELDRSRRNWQRLRAHVEQVSTTPWGRWADARSQGSPEYVASRRWLVAGLGGLAFTEALAGDLDRSQEYLAEMDAVAAEHDARAPGTTWVAGELARAVVAAERGDGETHAAAMGRLTPMIDRVEAWPLGIIADAIAVRATRGTDWALAQLVAARDRRDASPMALGGWIDTLAQYRIVLQTVLGGLTDAEETLAELPADCAAARIERARLALYSGDDQGALLLAQEIVTTGLAPRRRLDRCLIAATAAWGAGRPQEAFEALRLSAEIRAGNGLESPLWNVPFEALRAAAEAARDAGAVDLLPAIEAIPEPARTTRYERLTEMEQRTLEAVAVHRAINESAAELFVTPATVKKHLNSIYRKLRVKGREDAIAQATRMGILDRAQAPAAG